ncbi:hypothetical protein IQ249_11165 [Lusitaniella coriacea LEGE 07157]|uniref:Uncharacterized protein n=1 Tax=Lusitaniella coriacea LEGE 07157 TaxID=945747 RepID=A0A8J7DWN0_9CYAN|nr:hypothetical protein [Lusitaniella coriacea]MBE9116459.1 hypothetical protein [Lusitaniella coriacea LEGE 07157]
MLRTSSEMTTAIWHTRTCLFFLQRFAVFQARSRPFKEYLLKKRDRAR